MTPEPTAMTDIVSAPCPEWSTPAARSTPAALPSPSDGAPVRVTRTAP